MQVVLVNPEDNVIVALEPIDNGETVRFGDISVLVKNTIPRGHKIAIKDIAPNENIIKYGESIGHAIKPILKGEHVHVHNLKTNLSGTLEYHYNGNTNKGKKIEKLIEFPSINVFKRLNGEIGIRNELWIIPLVGCVNAIAKNILTAFLAEQPSLQGIDHIGILEHNFGCSQLGDDHENTKKMLAGMSMHPNAGGVLLLGLGCENNQMKDFLPLLGEFDTRRIKHFIAQEVGDEIEVGLSYLKELAEMMHNDKRERVEFSKLKIGLKCGGSDGLSGITANPLLGNLTDQLTAIGGTTVLTEVPEMFGAETLLMERCINKGVFEKTVNMVNTFKEYFIQHNLPVYENPSPGNKEGGISTLEDKSLGCTQKGGKATVVNVYEYAEKIKDAGLVLMNLPGNDMVASSGLAAAGCHIVLFTTGRGTPYGAFVPTLKISTNTDLFSRKPHWIDFNAGKLVENTSMNELLTEFVNYIKEVADGRLVNNEKMNFRTMAIWKNGVTL